MLSQKITTRDKLELLTIITRTLQILTSFVLLIVIVSFAIIKIKARKNKPAMISISNIRKGKEAMTNLIKENPSKEIHFSRDVQLTSTSSQKISTHLPKMKIFAVYNPNSNPNFYLHNRMNWFKNFD
jgi:hypothetical protein